MKTANSKSAKPDKDSNSLVTVTEVAEQVGREILESQLEPGAWATALYECGGRRQEALAMYARLRVRRLTKQRRVRLAKVRSFESRRLNHCMGDQSTREMIAKTIQEMLHQTRHGKSQNFIKPKLSLVWLALLFVGTAGTVASLGRLFSAYIPEELGNPLTLIALLSGVGAVWTALVLRFFLPKRWIMLGWNSGLVVTCNILCLSSLFLGTKVIKRAIATDTVVIPFQQQDAKPQAKATLVKPRTEQKPYLVSADDAKKSAKN